MGKCQWCGGHLKVILDLGSQPLANSLLRYQNEPEMTYPLLFCQCETCLLSQTMRFDYRCFGKGYPYFSSVNTAYVNQCADLAERLLRELKPKSVIEIGSNDGYMLQHFKHLSHVGFEPSEGPHLVAKARDIHSKCEYFDATGVKADLILAFNVLAHTPDLRNMIRNIKLALNPHGTVVVEIQDLTKLLEQSYFDTIYHEHYSYFEFNTLISCFEEEGLVLSSFEQLSSHGGSLRAFFKQESDWGTSRGKYADYFALAGRAKHFRAGFRRLLSDAGYAYKDVALFGAPAKGNTFLNYCGVKSDEVRFAVDETPAKQGKFLPGSRIPVFGLEALAEKKPDICVIMPWNFEDSIRKKLAEINTWGMRVITPYVL